MDVLDLEKDNDFLNLFKSSIKTDEIEFVLNGQKEKIIEEEKFRKLMDIYKNKYKLSEYLNDIVILNKLESSYCRVRIPLNNNNLETLKKNILNKSFVYDFVKDSSNTKMIKIRGPVVKINPSHHIKIDKETIVQNKLDNEDFKKRFLSDGEMILRVAKRNSFTFYECPFFKITADFNEIYFPLSNTKKYEIELEVHNINLAKYDLCIKKFFEGIRELIDLDKN